MVYLNYDAKAVKFYPYRTAFARNVVMKIDRVPNSDYRYPLEEEMARQLGVMTDNHTTYKVETDSGLSMYVTCSDRYYYVGLTIEVKNW